MSKKEFNIYDVLRLMEKSNDPKIQQIAREQYVAQRELDRESQARQEEEREHKRRLREENREWEKQCKEDAELSHKWICCPGFV
jgi:hypothetical protein